MNIEPTRRQLMLSFAVGCLSALAIAGITAMFLHTIGRRAWDALPPDVRFVRVSTGCAGAMARARALDVLVVPEELSTADDLDACRELVAELPLIYRLAASRSCLAITTEAASLGIGAVPVRRSDWP